MPCAWTILGLGPHKLIVKSRSLEHSVELNFRVAQLTTDGSPLTLNPLEAIVEPGATQVFEAIGGTDPFTWTLEPDCGTIVQVPGEPTRYEFTAPAAGGKICHLTVRDSRVPVARVERAEAHVVGTLTPHECEANCQACRSYLDPRPPR